MNESFPTPESRKEVTKEDVIAAYKPFVERGVTNPDPLDPADPEVQKANELFFEWQKQLDEKSKGDKEAEIRAGLLKSMFYVDAGFTDPEYLDEVLKEWLPATAEDATKEPDSPERAETRRQLAEAMLKIKGILKEAK